MKTMITFLAFTFFLNVSAQEKQNQVKKHEFTPEQIAELQTKKMELEFELNDKQLKDLYNLNLDEAKKRKEKMQEMKELKTEQKSLNTDEKYQKQIQHLSDIKIHQTEMKRILGYEKYKIWKEAKKNKRSNLHNSFQNKRGEMRNKKSQRNLS